MHWHQYLMPLKLYIYTVHLNALSTGLFVEIAHVVLFSIDMLMI